MSINVSDNSLYVKNKDTGELIPISILSSGADKSLEKIKEYADNAKAQVSAAIDDIETKKNEVLNGIPEDYTELSNNVNQLKTEINKYLKTDSSLTIRDGILGVNTADCVEADNTLPVTSAAVQVVVGNIGAILDTI